MQVFVLDLRHALRALARRPTFAVAVMLTLAIGVAPTATIVSLYRATLVRPLPVPAPEELVFLHRLNTTRGYYSSSSYPGYLEFRDRVRPVLATAAYAQFDVTLATKSDPLRLSALYVTDEYFAVLRIEPFLGRFLDRRPGGTSQDPVAVLSHRFWTARFGADPGVLGRALSIDERSVTVIGVAPQGFAGTDPGVAADIWFPLGCVEDFDRRATLPGMDWLEVVGRLNAQGGADQARIRAIAMATQIAPPPGTHESWTAVLSPGEHGNVYPHVRERLTRVLNLFVGFGILILCVVAANVANLLTTRAQERQRETVIRAAIGGSRAQAMRPMIVESTLLAAAGTLAGLLLALWIPPLLAQFTLPGEISVAGLRPRIHAAMATAFLLLGIAGGAAMGVVAILPFSRGVALLPRARAMGLDRKAARVRRAIAILQISGSLALTILAALLFRTLYGQLTLEPGFRTDRILLVSVDPRSGGDRSPLRTYEAIEEQIRRIPNVRSTGWVSVVPFGALRMRRSVWLDGFAESQPIDANVVGPGFFETLDIAIVRGRSFESGDRVGAPLVAIVNETMASKFWPGEDPIGKVIRASTTAPPCSIVGVARDNRYYDIRTLRAPQRPYLYFPLAQNAQPRMTLIVRRDGDRTGVATAIRERINVAATGAPVTILSAVDQVNQALSQERLSAALAFVLAVLGLMVAAVGLYAVLAYAIHQRIREMAVRMALGASPANVRRLVLREGCTLGAIGVVVGVGAAVPLSRFAVGLLRDISPLDPASFGAAAVLVAAISLIATAIPAARASRVDPGTGLRQD
jgi:putative ABC transport system permease protein